MADTVEQFLGAMTEFQAFLEAEQALTEATAGAPTSSMVSYSPSTRAGPS